jgi:hypothetical protein
LRRRGRAKVEHRQSLAIYLGSADANAKLEITDAQKKAGMDKWMKWATDNANAIVDLGSPLGKTKKINADGFRYQKPDDGLHDRTGRLTMKRHSYS